MRKRFTRVVVLAAVVGALVAASGPAFAAKKTTGHSGGHGGNGGTSASAVGNDVSYPQCGTTLPASPAFGVVGLNGGLANDLNPCLGPDPSSTASELYWAVTAATGAAAAQPKASLYLNTADPGNVYNGSPISDWPTSGSTPDGACVTTTVTLSSGAYQLGRNSPACAWQYGYNKATTDVTWLSGAAAAINKQVGSSVVPAAASAYPWWLDVETVNTWQTGAAGQAMNVADLQGMIAALRTAGATSVGAYSTASQWDQVTGTGATAGSLGGIPDWIPGAKRLAAAESNCADVSFTGGKVTLTQYSGHPDDNDYAC